MMLDRAPYRRSGFSLVEVLMAVLVIGIGVIPVISIFLSSSRTVEKGGVMLAATIGAQNILDRVKSDEFLWDHLEQTFPVPGDKLPGVELPSFFATKYQATAQVSIRLAPGHTILGTGAKETNLAEIVVEVHWVENGANRQTRLLTYKANTNSFNVRTSTKF
jgi:prepilin-type N-terminal cleavage/methylation domain-containing protein